MREVSAEQPADTIMPTKGKATIKESTTISSTPTKPACRPARRIKIPPATSRAAAKLDRHPYLVMAQGREESRFKHQLKAPHEKQHRRRRHTEKTARKQVRRSDRLTVSKPLRSATVLPPQSPLVVVAAHHPAAHSEHHVRADPQPRRIPLQGSHPPRSHSSTLPCPRRRRCSSGCCARRTSP